MIDFSINESRKSGAEIIRVSDTLIVIPARYESSRFPGKPLAKIDGKEMIRLVYENCRESGHRCVVVTDDDRIADCLAGNKIEFCRVDDDLNSGSERVYLAFMRQYAEDLNIKYIINVQGDEPLLTGEEINRLVDFQRKSRYDIATLVRKRSLTSPPDRIEFNGKNVVKVIYTVEDGRCHYFSRSPIPFGVNEKGEEYSWYQHIGVYSYKREALKLFCLETPSYYEKLERLEQLRALEINLTIGAITTELNLMGIDTPNDLLKLRGAKV